MKLYHVQTQEHSGSYLKVASIHTATLGLRRSEYQCALERSETAHLTHVCCRWTSLCLSSLCWCLPIPSTCSSTAGKWPAAEQTTLSLRPPKASKWLNQSYRRREKRFSLCAVSLFKLSDIVSFPCLRVQKREVKLFSTARFSLISPLIFDIF